MYKYDYTLLRELKEYGLDYLIPVYMPEDDDVDEGFGHAYEGRELDPAEDGYYDNFDFSEAIDREEEDVHDYHDYDDADLIDEFERDDYDDDEDDEDDEDDDYDDYDDDYDDDGGVNIFYAPAEPTYIPPREDNKTQLVMTLDDLIEVFGDDCVDPEEFLDSHVWELFGITKNQFKMIDWSLIREEDFQHFVEIFREEDRDFGIEKKIRYSMMQVLTGYRSTFYHVNRFDSSDEEVVRYIEHLTDECGVSDAAEKFSLYQDYLRFYPDAIAMNERRKQQIENGEHAEIFKYELFPKPSHLKDLHDKAMRDNQTRETERLKNASSYMDEDIKLATSSKIYKNYLYSNGQYTILPVTCYADLAREGKELCHCVASYGSMVAKGESYIYFIRRTSEPTVPFYTVEIIPPVLQGVVQKKAYLHQCYGKYDTTDKPDSLRDFIRQWADAKNLPIKCKI